MKRILVIMCLITSLVCYAAEQTSTTPQQQNMQMNQLQTIPQEFNQPIMQQDRQSGADYNLPVSCDTYDSCMELGLLERKVGVKSVLFYYSDVLKESRFNIYENISIKLSGNTCPPIMSVYKTVNTVNYTLDLFSTAKDNGCIRYYTNVTGEGRNRDTVMGQLEISFCSSDELFNSCKQALLYSRYNMFTDGQENKRMKSNIGYKENKYGN